MGLAWLGLVVAAVGSLVLRYRQAEGQQRQQIKWLAYALVLVTVAFGVDASVALSAPALYPAVFPVIQVIPVTVVVAAAIAILRHRLFDIDLLINRTLVYGAHRLSCSRIRARRELARRSVPGRPRAGHHRCAGGRTALTGETLGVRWMLTCKTERRPFSDQTRRATTRHSYPLLSAVRPESASHSTLLAPL